MAGWLVFCCCYLHFALDIRAPSKYLAFGFGCWDLHGVLKGFFWQLAQGSRKISASMLGCREFGVEKKWRVVSNSRVESIRAASTSQSWLCMDAKVSSAFHVLETSGAGQSSTLQDLLSRGRLSPLYTHIYLYVYIHITKPSSGNLASHSEAHATSSCQAHGATSTQAERAQTLDLLRLRSYSSVTDRLFEESDKPGVAASAHETVAHRHTSRPSILISRLYVPCAALALDEL